MDAVSILALGHVFTANMTGNTVFLGFSLGGAHGFSIPNSITALLGFFIGAAFGGRLATVGNAAHAFRDGGVASLFCAAIAAVQFSPLPQSGAALDGVIAVTALAMGLQNATARKLGVPDLTTTVLTLTITGLAADSRIAGGVNPRWQRRCAAVLAMIGGAVVGALLVSQSVALPLLPAPRQLPYVRSPGMSSTPERETHERTFAHFISHRPVSGRGPGRAGSAGTLDARREASTDRGATAERKQAYGNIRGWFEGCLIRDCGLLPACAGFRDYDLSGRRLRVALAGAITVMRVHPAEIEHRLLVRDETLAQGGAVLVVDSDRLTISKTIRLLQHYGAIDVYQHGREVRAAVKEQA